MTEDLETELREVLRAHLLSDDVTVEQARETVAVIHDDLAEMSEGPL